MLSGSYSEKYLLFAYRKYDDKSMYIELSIDLNAPVNVANVPHTGSKSTHNIQNPHVMCE